MSELLNILFTENYAVKHEDKHRILLHIMEMKRSTETLMPFIK